MQKLPEGGAPGGHNPPGRASTPGAPLGGGVVVPTWAPHLSLRPTLSPTSRKKFTLALSPEFLLILLPFSISLLEAPFPKLFRGIVAWYVTPSFVQLVFVLVVYTLNK